MGELLLVENPKRRRRHKHRRRNPRHRLRRRNPSFHRRHRRHHRRSNPMSLGGFKGMIKPVLKEGFVQAGGALALDAVWGYVNPKLPATLSSSPYLQFAVKCLVAIGVGVVGGKVLRGRARDLAVGGVTVAAHDMLKSVLQSSLPSVFGAGGTLALSGYGAYLSGSAPVVGTATFPRTHTIPRTYAGLGAYLSGDASGGAGVYTDDCMGFDPWGDGA